MNNKVVFDIDGVLGDFENEFCKKFGYDNRHLVSLEARYPRETDLIDIFVNLSPVYERLDIVPLGYKMLKWCEQNGMEIHIVSSRPSYTLSTTVQWLRQNKIPFAGISVDQTPKSFRIKHINPLFIVEDILDVCIQCSNMGIPSFLIDWPWNQDGSLGGNIHRVKQFDDFLDVIHSI